jgi:hypothetical protein
MDDMDIIQRLVELKGDKVELGTQDCHKWKLSHKNCCECPSTLGCSKVVRVGIAVLSSNEYNGDIIQDTIDKLLLAKSVEELNAIHIPEGY